ncbi:hypothetical protein BBP40_007213 [Aspergillus hancockii]|nr:hypothetical protein BBP40_007213 [Aspergillus hancockii]
MSNPPIYSNRVETEAFTLHTARLILDSVRGHDTRVSGQGASCLRIVDLCTGSGCIALLLHALLASYIDRLSILGVDLSPTAIKLANKNLKHNVRLNLLSNRAATEVFFREGNVLDYGDCKPPVVKEVLRHFQGLSSNAEPYCDVLISNPPYISPKSFWDGTTSRSVRIFEPKLALVPPIGSSSMVLRIDKHEDLFYYHIILLSFEIRAKLVVLECGSRSQAERVAAIGKALCNEHRANVSIGIWPDLGTLDSDGIYFEDEPHAVVLQAWL